MRVLLVVNRAWNVLNFRVGLVRGILEAGHELYVAVPPDSDAARLRALGCHVLALPMDNGGTRPHHDLLLLWRLRGLMRKVRPDALLGFTAKPNIYGSIAARWTGVPVINNIAGLGATFIREGLLTRIVRILYRAALKRSRVVFFQNPDDQRLFVETRLVREAQTRLLPGSGVDLDRFSPRPLPSDHGSTCRFLFLGRMLYDKGVAEFVEAARMLREALPDTRFCLLGIIDPDNPAAIPPEQIARWVSDGAIEYLGSADDVRPHVAAADCVVLPSYREGTPRSLLEAAAMARPIVTTDVAGCREVVRDGDNGLLCAARDAAGLAAAMRRVAQMSAADRSAMGRRGRLRAERDFDERLVVDAYLRALAQIQSTRRGPSSPATSLRA